MYLWLLIFTKYAPVSFRVRLLIQNPIILSVKFPVYTNLLSVTLTIQASNIKIFTSVVLDEEALK